MRGEVDLLQLDHLHQGRVRWRQQDVVLAVAVDSDVDTVDIAAVAAILEDVKEFITIETIGKSCQDLALADAITDSEAGRNLSTESDVGELLDVHVDDQSEEDGAKLERHLSFLDFFFSNLVHVRETFTCYILFNFITNCFDFLAVFNRVEQFFVDIDKGVWNIFCDTIDLVSCYFLCFWNFLYLSK